MVALVSCGPYWISGRDRIEFGEINDRQFGKLPLILNVSWFLRPLSRGRSSLSWRGLSWARLSRTRPKKPEQNDAAHSTQNVSYPN